MKDEYKVELKDTARSDDGRRMSVGVMGLGLLFLDQTVTSPRGNLFVDAAPLAFLAGGACLVDFAGH